MKTLLLTLTLLLPTLTLAHEGELEHVEQQAIDQFHELQKTDFYQEQIGEMQKDGYKCDPKTTEALALAGSCGFAGCGTRFLVVTQCSRGNVVNTAYKSIAAIVSSGLFEKAHDYEMVSQEKFEALQFGE